MSRGWVTMADMQKRIIELEQQLKGGTEMSKELFDRASNIASRVTFRDWEVDVVWKHDTGVIFLRVEFYAPDIHTGEQKLQLGRKWLLSQHMTDSEIVNTIYLAIATAEEHERREDFKFSGERIYGPHWDVQVLAEVASEFETDRRAEAV